MDFNIELVKVLAVVVFILNLWWSFRCIQKLQVWNLFISAFISLGLSFLYDYSISLLFNLISIYHGVNAFLIIKRLKMDEQDV